jgi:hypothetical protein
LAFAALDPVKERREGKDDGLPQRKLNEGKEEKRYRGRSGPWRNSCLVAAMFVLDRIWGELQVEQYQYREDNFKS